VVKAYSLFLALAVAAGALSGADTAALRKAPELAFTLPGQGQKLLSQYRGKVVALEFIMTTCPHCQAASKVMTKYQQEFASRGFQALDLAINALDNGSDENTANALVSNFATTYQVGVPVGWLPRDQMISFMGFSIMDRLVVPQLALIDRKGFIHYQTPAASGLEWDKVMDEATVHQHIEELLAGGSANTHPSKATHLVASKKGI
jgi:thiol-disulfide isomerase/thioredoxin